MPSDYAAQFGLDLNDPNVASEDPDGDGLSNLQESQLGTDPFSADTDHDDWNDGDDDNPLSRMYVPYGNPKFTADDGVVYPWPEWATAAYKIGGSFLTNDVQCWFVSSADTNPASLQIEVDRQTISDNAILQLTYFVTSNSSVHIDLYDADGQVVAPDIAGNLLVLAGGLLHGALSAGGLGMGVSNAGFRHVAVVEWNRDACATLRDNKRRGIAPVAEWPDIFDCEVVEESVGTRVDDQNLLAEWQRLELVLLQHFHQPRAAKALPVC